MNDIADGTAATKTTVAYLLSTSNGRKRMIGNGALLHDRAAWRVALYSVYQKRNIDHTYFVRPDIIYTIFGSEIRETMLNPIYNSRIFFQ